MPPISLSLSNCWGGGSSFFCWNDSLGPQNTWPHVADLAYDDCMVPVDVETLAGGVGSKKKHKAGNEVHEYLLIHFLQAATCLWPTRKNETRIGNNAHL